jgi:hypothetical protein
LSSLVSFACVCLEKRSGIPRKIVLISHVQPLFETAKVATLQHLNHITPMGRNVLFAIIIGKLLTIRDSGEFTRFELNCAVAEFSRTFLHSNDDRVDSSMIVDAVDDLLFQKVLNQSGSNKNLRYRLDLYLINLILQIKDLPLRIEQALTKALQEQKLF